MSTSTLSLKSTGQFLPSDLATLPDRARAHFEFWRSALEPLFSVERDITRAIAQAAIQIRRPQKSVESKYYAVKKHGWEVLIDRRLCGPDHWNMGKKRSLSDEDKTLVKTYCERYQRSSSAAVRALRRDYIKGVISTETPLNTATGYPHGWSDENLLRYKPTKFELKTARIGRSAAASERRLVYTSRSELWVGSHYLFDDMWHDHFVNQLDQRKAGRPLEFHALDLYSANKFAWGMRVRMKSDTGIMEGLKGADMRFLLACIMGGTGFSPRGTVFVVENGTAAVSDDIERILHEESGGLITIERAGMTGAAAAAHQYAGCAKGNFHLKAGLESLGNLIHNEMAALPGQTGKDRDHRPEQLHGLLKRNDALLIALSQLSPERQEMLRWDLLTIQQFRMIADEVYARINARTEHDLEGWDMHYVRDLRRGGMRRLGPVEVWKPGSRQLRTFRPEAVAMLLSRDEGREISTRAGMFQLVNGEVSGDLLRYDARILKDREKYRTVLNPYDPSILFAYDSKGRFVTACPRILSADRGNLDAVHRACGEAARAEAEALAPFRTRHLAEARQKAANHRWNADVVSGPQREQESLADRAEEALTSRNIHSSPLPVTHIPAYHDDSTLDY